MGHLGLRKQYSLSAIHAEKAWEITTGSSTIKVGIIDSGIFNHRDLLKNLVEGWDFINNNTDTYDDTVGHGTYVAGVIGGEQNKNGVSGICRNIQIVPLQVLDKNALFPIEAVIKAIEYANEKGIDIINYCDSSDEYHYEFERAIKNYDGLFVCSAGNNGRNIDEIKRYPASYKLSNIISVASTDQHDALAKTSNYGIQTVHLAAPGVGIYSTTNKSGYRPVSGTSIATPYVTGVAALIKSVYPKAEPGLIKETILESVDQVEELRGKLFSGGRLNAYKAVYRARFISSP